MKLCMRRTQNNNLSEDTIYSGGPDKGGNQENNPFQVVPSRKTLSMYSVCAFFSGIFAPEVLRKYW